MITCHLFSFSVYENGLLNVTEHISIEEGIKPCLPMWAGQNSGRDRLSNFKFKCFVLDNLGL